MSSNRKSARSLLLLKAQKDDYCVHIRVCMRVSPSEEIYIFHPIFFSTMHHTHSITHTHSMNVQHEHKLRYGCTLHKKPLSHRFFCFLFPTPIFQHVIQQCTHTHHKSPIAYKSLHPMLGVLTQECIIRLLPGNYLVIPLLTSILYVRIVVRF